MTIRRLTANDVASLQALNNLFADVFEDPKSYAQSKPSSQYLSNFLNDDTHIIIVAEENQRVIGGLVAYCLTKFEQERKEIYLYDLAVAKSKQRQGIGKKLIEEIKRTAKEMGAYVVFLQADENDAAVKFYEGLKPSENAKTRNFDFKV